MEERLNIVLSLSLPAETAETQSPGPQPEISESQPEDSALPSGWRLLRENDWKPAPLGVFVSV